MNILKYKKSTLLTLAVAVLLLIASCGQAGFDVSLNPDDVTDIDLSALTGFGYIIKIETYVETGNYGIDLDKLIYDYSFNNKGTNAVNIEVRLSLFGDATLNDNNKLTLFTTSSGGYGTTPAEQVWLTATYKDRNPITTDGYGWVSMIGSPASPVEITGNSVISGSTEISNSAVIDQILKQEGIWVVTYVSPGLSLPSLGSAMDLTGQTIQVTGSKDTGFFPGAFGGL